MIGVTRILAIDPGMASMGYGVVEGDVDKATALDYGVLVTGARVPAEKRLLSLYRGVLGLLERYQPSEFAIETFVARNVRSALAVGQARGVALLAAAEKGLPVYEYTPLQVKQAAVGYGRSEKKQVQEMVRLQLGLSSAPQPDDAADALAVAICHMRGRQMARLIAEANESL